MMLRSIATRVEDADVNDGRGGLHFLYLVLHAEDAQLLLVHWLRELLLDCVRRNASVLKHILYYANLSSFLARNNFAR